MAKVLYEGALVNSGYTLRDYAGFSNRFYRLFNGALGLARDAPLKEVEVDLEESEEEPNNNNNNDDARPSSSNEGDINLDDFDFTMGD